MLQFILPFVTKNKTLLKAIAIAVVVIAFIGLVTWTIGRIYDAGFEAGNAKADRAISEAKLAAEIERNRAQKKLIETERAMRALEQDAARRIADARSDGEVQVRTVEKVIRENPDFANIRRPADLQRVRDDQLAAIRRAAERAAATAKLPSAGVSSVPSTSDPDRGNPGRNGGR